MSSYIFIPQVNLWKLLLHHRKIEEELHTPNLLNEVVSAELNYNNNNKKTQV